MVLALVSPYGLLKQWQLNWGKANFAARVFDFLPGLGFWDDDLVVLSKQAFCLRGADAVENAGARTEGHATLIVMTPRTAAGDDLTEMVEDCDGYHGNPLSFRT